MKRIVQTLVFALAACVSQIGLAQSSVDDLKSELTKQFENNALPGLAISIVKDGKVLIEDGFGFADVESKKKYSSVTTQPIGSISKTFIAVAMMKAIELGHLELKTNVNDVLPFKVINPHSPETPITVEHLVTHTSGITDRNAFYYGCYRFSKDADESSEVVKLMTSVGVGAGDRKPLGEMLKSYLATDGDSYQADNFIAVAAGKCHEYSNIGASLAAYLIEVKSGTKYSEFVQKHIFDPLEMKDTGFVLDMKRQPNASTLYYAKDKTLPNYTNDSYPDGSVKTSCQDMSKYMIEMIRVYHGESKLLKPASGKAMFKSLLKADTPGLERSQQAVFWVVKGPQAGHDGSDPGTMTIMKMHLEKKVGMFVMTNLDSEIAEDAKATTQAFRSAIKAAMPVLTK